MADFDWGDIRLSRLTLRETFAAAESGGDPRTLALEGQESWPPRARADVVAVHDSINALGVGVPVAVTFTDKPERNGYYQVKDASSTWTEYRGEMATATWKIGLERLGSAGEIDLQSRLTGTVRDNDFSLLGERWHAPPIGHYAYYTGASNPTSMTRTGADGTITIYRSVPADTSPRWGCDPSDYLAGRVRINDTAAASAYEVDGTDRPLPAADWALSNGLVNVTPSASAGVLDVQAYTDGAWHSKYWNIALGGSTVAAWDAASILRNDPEQCILRLTASRNPGRATLDLTLRRGSRFVEGYLQSGTSTTLAVYLQAAETNTSFAASGYVAATGSDPDGNQFAAGSAHTFTAHTDGGLSLADATALDFWIGVIATQATLNSNPGFETNTSGWTATNATLTRSSTQAKHGSWSGLITSTAGSSPRIQTTPVVAVTPGATYRASGWLYAPSPIPTGVGVSVNWYDAGQSYLSTSSNSSAPASGVWFFADNNFTAPASAAYAALVPTIGGSPGAGVLLYGDDLRLRAATPAGDAATDLRNMYVACLAESTYAVRR
jgi:hypothetical protein